MNDVVLNGEKYDVPWDLVLAEHGEIIIDIKDYKWETDEMYQRFMEVSHLFFYDVYNKNLGLPVNDRILHNINIDLKSVFQKLEMEGIVWKNRNNTWCFDYGQGRQIWI